jgi:hypothetical protein
MIEQWNAKQQEKLQKLKKKNKDQQTLLKEVRETNIKLYWHNVVLKTKLKQRNTKGSLYHTVKVSKFEASYNFDFLMNTRNTYAKVLKNVIKIYTEAEYFRICKYFSHHNRGIYSFRPILKDQLNIRLGGRDSNYLYEKACIVNYSWKI